MSLTSVIKAQSCGTERWPFHLCEQNKGTFKKANYYTQMLIENDFANVPARTPMQTNILLKGQLFCFGTQDLSHGNIDWEKGERCKVWS